MDRPEYLQDIYKRRPGSLYAVYQRAVDIATLERQKNPNEKWFDKSALKLAQLAAKISKGELQEHD